MSKLLICTVIPCLNEEQTLAATCHSLGFGVGNEMIDDSVMIIVDNGSTDRTQSVIREVQDRSPGGAVVSAEELEQGYVPPRRRGNDLAAEIAVARGFSKETTLIVQADADTIYEAGYLEALRQGAISQGPNVLLNSCMGWSTEFVRQHSGYIALCDGVDEKFSSLLDDNQADVIIDDKGCGYRLADYERWGGHQREFTFLGNEVLSETSRLYLRARAHGARRYLCDAATALHSARRIHVEPALSFATAGFPRDAYFRARWQRIYHGSNTLVDFENSNLQLQLRPAIAARRAHLWGLFGLLPQHVANTLGENHLLKDDFKADIACLPKRSLEILRSSPSVLLEDIFQRVDQQIFEAP